MLSKFCLPLSTLIGVGLSCTSAVVAQEGALTPKMDNTVPRAKAPLQVQIQHDEKVPAIAPQFEIGKKLNPAALMALTPGNQWYAIPHWFAGTWRSDHQILLYLKSYATGKKFRGQHIVKEVSEIVEGTQRDKQGQIWKYVKVPTTLTVQTADGIAYLESQREEPLSITSAKVVRRIFYTDLQVNEFQIIESVSQVESINTYTLEAENVIKLHASLKSFDENGNPKVLQESEKLLVKSAPFRETDRDGKLNLRELFAEFLRRTGQMD